MKKVLILCEEGVDFFMYDTRLCDCETVTKKIPKWIRFFIRALEIIHLPVSFLRYGDWMCNIHQYDVIIIFQSAVAGFTTFPALKYVHKKSSAKVIIWYWNGMAQIKDAEKKLEIYRGYSDEIWTYNKGDAEKYGFKYSSEFFYEFLPIPNVPINTDAFFIGHSKKRLEELLELEDALNKQGLRLLFKILETPGYSYTEEQKKRLCNKRMTYNEVLNQIGKSRAIVEIDSTGDITLRALEALFFKKKLITNVVCILEYDFYHPDNIFVLGKDNLNDIKEFLEKPFVQIDFNIVEQYTFKTWLNHLSGMDLI